MSQYIDFKSNEVLLTWVEKIYFIGKVSYLLRQNKYISCDKKTKSVTMPKFTSQILLLFSKVLHILEKLLLKNFTGLKVVS